MTNFKSASPHQDVLIEVGQSPATGKWHARITMRHDVCFYSPPCETESEAMACKECALEAIVGNLLKGVETSSWVN